MAIPTIRAVATDSKRGFGLFVSKHNKKDDTILVFDRTAETAVRGPYEIEEALYDNKYKNSTLVASYQIIENENGRYDLYDMQHNLQLKINRRNQQHLAEYGLYHYLGLKGMWVKEVV